jgi:NAD(P)-dependent dehydrogenase (short-subunit alcohol dehydrogenase family)
MSYAIIGFVKIGHALAKAFARKGIEVSVATTRDPESFAADAAAIGPKVLPRTLAEAVKAHIIFLAVRFDAHQDVAKALPTWRGKIIVDVTNAYGVPPEELGGQPSSKFVAQAFAGGSWSRASTIWSLPFLTKIRPCMAAGESCSWRATMTLLQRRLARLRKISDSRRSNLAGSRKAACLFKPAEIAGAG